MNKPAFRFGDRIGNNAGSIEGVVISGPDAKGEYTVCRRAYLDHLSMPAGDMELLPPLRDVHTGRTKP